MEGFLRSLQANGLIFVGFLVALALAYLFARWFIKHQAPDDEVAQTARVWTNFVTTSLVIVAVVVLSWRAFEMASINRMPRADVDRTGVYEQMNKLR